MYIYTYPLRKLFPAVYSKGLKTDHSGQAKKEGVTTDGMWHTAHVSLMCEYRRPKRTETRTISLIMEGLEAGKGERRKGLVS